MIYLFTGSNGSGKTLGAFELIDKVLLKDDPSRPVYYYSPETQPLNINTSVLPHWHALALTEARAWFDLPYGSIILIDEFRHVFPYRDSKNKIPDYVDRLSEHRSKGFDFVLTAQKPTGQFDPAIQGFIEEHYHHIRLKGSDRIRVLTFNAFESNPLKPSFHNAPEVSLKKLNKKYFDWYQSAIIHTSSNRLPYAKAILIFSLVFPFFGLLWFGYSKLSSFAQPSFDLEINPSFQPHALPSPGPQVSISSLSEYSEPDYLPHTLPKYEHLTKPVTVPIISACVHHRKQRRCDCYTQRATPIDVPLDFCLSYIENGYFYDFVNDDGTLNNRDNKNNL